MRHRQLFRLVCFACLMLVAASCGSSANSATSVETNDRPQSFEDLDIGSPIAEMLGIDFGFDSDQQAEQAEMQREAGRITAECMLEKGFEYTAIDPSTFEFFGPGSDELPYFSEAWVEKYGFGITTQRFPQSSVGELVGFNDEAFGPDEQFVDPNDAYIESLSEGERDAYFRSPSWNTARF